MPTDLHSPFLGALAGACYGALTFLFNYLFWIEGVLGTLDHGGRKVQKDYVLAKVVSDLPDNAARRAAFNAKWRPRMWFGLRCALIIGAVFGAVNNQ